MRAGASESPTTVAVRADSEEEREEIAQLSSNEQIRRLIEQNVKKGLDVADWCFVLDLGTRRFEGAAANILDDPRIRDLYLGSLAGATADKESDQ